ncbi:stage III sporulation protein AF [Paenibacillus sp. DYY-L-2]|uniref:stage III sporulation protein AF n=1 Tax=Paenibacillus sp. DYY-L-2 TaxID=3447013 RepID=UPI003F4F9BBC
MDFLGEWLREIIIVVLIAVFIDLLLPNRSMERYVKFVVSLLILLTLLSPVMRLFSPDAERQIEAAFADGWGGSDASELAASTEVILRQGEELRKQQEEEALQWAGEEAARQMKQQIERETGMPVKRVTVKISERKPAEEGEAGSKDAGVDPTIQSVEVIMKQTEKIEALEETASSERKVKVEPVERVEVKITDSSASGEGEGDRNDQGNMEDVKTSEAMANAESSEVAGRPTDSRGHSVPVQAIEDLLYRDWGIAKEAVSVREEDESEK